MLGTLEQNTAKRQGYTAIFLNLAFMLLWVGQMISYLGDRLDQLTLLHAAREHVENSAVVMNQMSFFMVLPFILFAPWAGPVADRYSRKAILLWTSLFQGLVILAVPLLAPTAFVQKHLVIMIYLVIFLIGSFTVFFYTAKTALIPQIVGESELMAANSLCSFAGTLMTLFGTFLATGLLHLVNAGVFHVSIMFYLDAASYFISGAMFVFIFVPKRARLAPVERDETFRQKIREGMRYVAGHFAVLKLLVLSATVYFLSGLVFSVVNGAVLGPKALNWSAETYSLVVGILGVGMLVGAIAATLGQNRIGSLDRFVGGCFLLVALIILPFAGLRRIIQLDLSKTAMIAGVLAPPLFIVGLAGGALIVLVVTLLQRSAPRRMHGRIFALNSMCDTAMQLLAIGIGSTLLGFGLLKTVVILACVVSVAAMLGVIVTDEFARHWFLRSLVRMILRTYCRAEYQGRENVPADGALIVASNHISWVDTFFVGSAVPRLIHFMAAREYYDRWYLKWFMWLFGTIALERGKGSRRPFRRAILALRRGRVVGIFPEGGMSRSGRFQKLEGGIGLLAAETQAPILPVAIIGADKVMGPKYKFPVPRKASVRIGKPIVTSGLSRSEVVAAVDAAIRELLGQPQPVLERQRAAVTDQS